MMTETILSALKFSTLVLIQYGEVKRTSLLILKLKGLIGRINQVLDKRAKSWSSFSRYSISPNKSLILFVRIYFTAIQ